MKRGHLVIILLWSVVLSSFVGTCLARMGGRRMGGLNPEGNPANGGYYNGSTTRRSSDSSSSQPTVDTKAVDDALAAYNDARAKANAANDALLSEVDRLRAANIASAGYQSVLAEQRAAHTAYLAVVQPLQAAAEAQPAYQTAVTDKANASAQLKKLQDDPTSSPDQLTAAASAVLNAGSRITQLESDAVSNNQNVVNAHARETAADVKVGQLDKQFEATIRTNPQWIAARQALDEDMAAEITAGEAYSDALSAAGDLEAANTVTAEIGKQKELLAKDGLKTAN